MLTFMKTTVNLREPVRLRLEQYAAREGKTLSDAVNDLLAEALLGRSGTAFASHGAGEADVDDLGVHAEKYLREGFA